MNLRALFHVCLLVATWTTTASAQSGVELERVASGVPRPIGVAHAGDGSGRLFLLSQTGQVWILNGGRVLPTPFLDIADRLRCCGEQGLLGLAFHPDFETNGWFFVNYTARSGRTVIARFAVSPDPARADPSSEVEVLSFRQPQSNHNGGHLSFGSDGFLYVASGDGGGAGDTANNAQALDTFLGKILRLDVDGLPYAVPPSNPFTGQPQARPEIFAYGLRNPWRFSFDRRTGDLFLGDVGQNAVEEIDLIPAGTSGQNFGWRRMEGSQCFNPTTGCDDGTLTLPIVEYGHNEGCSVTAGYRYRGREVSALSGAFLFGDFCTGRIWTARPAGDGTWSRSLLRDTNFSISSFGEDESGELYVVDLNGAVYRFSSDSILADGFDGGDTSAWGRSRRVAVTAPGLRGSPFALRVEANNTTQRAFVQTRQPSRERTFRAIFRLRVQELQGSAEGVEIVELQGSGRRHTRLLLEVDGGSFLATLVAETADGQLVRIGSTRVRPERTIQLGVEWSAASSPAAADGVARLLRRDRTVAERTDLRTGGWTVNRFRAGAPRGTAGWAGSFLLDDFVLSR